MLLVLIYIPSLGRVREGLSLPAFPPSGGLGRGFPYLHSLPREGQGGAVLQLPDYQSIINLLAKGHLLSSKRCPFGVQFMAFCIAFCRLLQIRRCSSASRPICKYSERRVQSKIKKRSFLSLLCRAASYIREANIIKGECYGKPKTKFFKFALPRRILYSVSFTAWIYGL